MATHISWPSIELLHNVVKTATYWFERVGVPYPTLTYKAKVKLHGTNCSVQVGDTILTQSREIFLTPEEDLKGFSKWIHSHPEAFAKCQKGITIFGEWCGEGVEGGMAISKHSKIWAIFGIIIGDGETAEMVVDPEQIKKYLAEVDLPGMYILPWEAGIETTINYGSEDSLKQAAAYLSEVVTKVEAEDPWVKRTFGLEGVGEGVVLYPMIDRLDRDFYPRYMFKAKGEKHRTVKTKEAVVVSAETVSNIQDFATLVVTEARLRQGVSVACGGIIDLKLMGKFLQWVTTDTEKETKAELEASGLTWPQVKNAVMMQARDWYKAQA